MNFGRVSRKPKAISTDRERDRELETRRSIDEAWAELAIRRLEELQSGRVIGLPGEEVFAALKARFQSRRSK